MGALTNFRASDFEAFAKGEKKPAKKAAAKKAAAPAQDPNKVPEGTTDEILDWVGNDPARARKALNEEKKDDKPRVTLVEPLEKIIEDDKAAKKAEADEKRAAKKAAEKSE